MLRCGLGCLVAPYFEDTHFTVGIYHNTLEWMMALSDRQVRVMRWRLRLMEFDYDVLYQPGLVPEVPDALSRLD